MLSAGKKKTRGEGIDSSLKTALNNQAVQTGKVQHLLLSRVLPNPLNKRDLVIPLDDFLSVLKIGSNDSAVYVDGDTLVFPERDELANLGISLDLRTYQEEQFYDKIRELALSIFRHDGELIQPVECTPHEDNFMLGSGHRRWFASHFVPSKTAIEALVKPKGTYDELQLSLRRWDENDKRHDLSLIERIDHVAELMDHLASKSAGKVKQSEVAALLSITKYDMSYYAKIIKSDLRETERAIVNANQLDDLRTVADICRIEDSENRYRAFEIYQDKGNTAARAFVQRCLDALKNTEVQKKAPARPKKIAPSPEGVSRLVDLLNDAAPDLVADMDLSSDPAVLLESILKRLEDTDS